MTAEYQKWPKMGGKTSLISLGLARSHPQELEVAPRSGPYLLVIYKGKKCHFPRLYFVAKIIDCNSLIDEQNLQL